MKMTHFLLINTASACHFPPFRYQVQFVGAIKAAFPDVCETSTKQQGETFGDPTLLDRGCALLNAFVNARLMGEDAAVFNRLLSLVDAALLQHASQGFKSNPLYAEWSTDLTRVRLLECHARITEIYYGDVATNNSRECSVNNKNDSIRSRSLATPETSEAWSNHTKQCTNALVRGWIGVLWQSMWLKQCGSNSAGIKCDQSDAARCQSQISRSSLRHPRVCDAIQRCREHAALALSHHIEHNSKHTLIVLVSDLVDRVDLQMEIVRSRVRSNDLDKASTLLGVHVVSWMQHALRIARALAKVPQDSESKQSKSLMAGSLADMGVDLTQFARHSHPQLASQAARCAIFLPEAADLLCDSELMRIAMCVTAESLKNSSLFPKDIELLEGLARASRIAVTHNAELACMFFLVACSSPSMHLLPDQTIQIASDSAVNAILHCEQCSGDFVCHVIRWVASVLSCDDRRAAIVLKTFSGACNASCGDGDDEPRMHGLVITVAPRALALARRILGKHHMQLQTRGLETNCPHEKLPPLSYAVNALSFLVSASSAVQPVNAEASAVLLKESLQLAVQISGVAEAVASASKGQARLDAQESAKAAVSQLSTMASSDPSAFKSLVASLPAAMKVQLQRSLSSAVGVVTSQRVVARASNATRAGINLPIKFPAN